MNMSDIEKGSIQVVGRDGSRVWLQCLKSDVPLLPKKGIASGSSCFVLDALEQEVSVYLYNRAVTEIEGTWYGV